MEMQYKLQIYPSYEVGTQTKRFKKMLFNRVGEYRYLHSQPHITLLHFIADSSWEHELAHAIGNAAGEFSKFTVYLKGVSSFTNTLYIKVLYQDYLQVLTNKVRQSINPYIKGEQISSPTFVRDFHLTIGSGLSPENLVEGIALLKKQEYEASFEATGVKFLSNAGGGTGNNLVSEFNFGGGFHPGGPQFRSRIASSVAASLSELYTTGGPQQLSLF